MAMAMIAMKFGTAVMSQRPPVLRQRLIVVIRGLRNQLRMTIRVCEALVPNHDSVQALCLP